MNRDRRQVQRRAVSQHERRLEPRVDANLVRLLTVAIRDGVEGHVRVFDVVRHNRAQISSVVRCGRERSVGDTGERADELP